MKDGHLIKYWSASQHQSPAMEGGFLQIGWCWWNIFSSFIKANSGKPVAEIPLCRLRLKANVRPARIFDKRNIWEKKCSRWSPRWKWLLILWNTKPPVELFAQCNAVYTLICCFIWLYSPSNKHKDQYCIECKLLVVIQSRELLPLIEIGGEGGCMLVGCEPNQWPATNDVHTGIYDRVGI